jgi:hypothetical protein
MTPIEKVLFYDILSAIGLLLSETLFDKETMSARESPPFCIDALHKSCATIWETGT